MDPISIAVGLAMGAALAGLVAALVFRPALRESEIRRTTAEERVLQLVEQGQSARGEIGRLEAQLREAVSFRMAAERVRELEGELKEERTARGALETERARAAEERKALDEKLELLRNAREQMTAEFKLASAEVTAQTRDELLKQAGETLARHREAAGNDFELRQKAIQGLVGPLGQALDKYEQHLRELERKNAGLDQQNLHVMQLVSDTRNETSKLVRALRQPQVRGRWGEVQLRRVAEMAGMVENCDFHEQVSVNSPSGRQRPDMVVRMPGGRSAVIDAKVPLEAYLDAMNAEDEPLRVRRMADHARLVRDHVRKLGSKGYWEAMAESPAFTVMFVPDPFLSAALEQEPAIMEDAWRANVVIATPMTLFTVLHIVADDWRRAQFEENSRRIVEAGRDLHKRLATFLDHFGKAGAGLKAAVNRYNDAVGSLERMVLPKAREFGRLGVLPVQESELTTLASIADSPRALVAPEAPVQGAPPSEAA